MALLERSVIVPFYNGIASYLRGAHTRVAEGGITLLDYSDTLGDKEGLQKVARTARCRLKKRASQVSTEARPVTFDLYMVTGS